MFFWIPLINKTGRRPVYVISFVFFFLCTVWAALGKTYNQELVARMGIGLFSGGAECLCPLTITDIVRSFRLLELGSTTDPPAFQFFAHERGTYMGVYQGAFYAASATRSRANLTPSLTQSYSRLESASAVSPSRIPQVSQITANLAHSHCLRPRRPRDWQLAQHLVSSSQIQNLATELTTSLASSWVGAGLMYGSRYSHFVNPTNDTHARSGFSTLLVVFTFPETAYHRTQVDRKHVFASGTAGDVDSEKEDSPKGATEEVTPIPPLKTYWQKLRLFSGTYTQEPFWKMFLVSPPSPSMQSLLKERIFSDLSAWFSSLPCCGVPCSCKSSGCTHSLCSLTVLLLRSAVTVGFVRFSLDSSVLFSDRLLHSSSASRLTSPSPWDLLPTSSPRSNPRSCVFSTGARE